VEREEERPSAAGRVRSTSDDEVGRAPTSNAADRWASCAALKRPAQNAVASWLLTWRVGCTAAMRCGGGRGVGLSACGESSWLGCELVVREVWTRLRMFSITTDARGVCTSFGGADVAVVGASAAWMGCSRE